MLDSVSVESVRIPLQALAGSGCWPVYDYWHRLRGGRPAPTWSEFDLWNLPADAIRYTHVVDVREDPFDLVYRFWGTGMTDVLQFERTGKSLLSTSMGYLNEARRQQVLADYREVIETRRPLPFLWNAATARESTRRLIVPSLRLPFCADGERVTQILTNFDFVGTREVWEAMFTRRD